jgi:hypothetical protein
MLLSYHVSVDAVSREGNGDTCVTLFRGIRTLKSESREPTFSDDNNLDTDHGDCGGGQRADGRAVLCLLLLGDGRLSANAGVGGNEGHAADQPDDLESCISERFFWNGSGLFARHDHLRMAAATRVRLGFRSSVRTTSLEIGRDEMNKTMTVLVLGATGATGRLLVQQLLDRGLRVKAIVRSPDSLPDSLRHHENLSVIRASVLDLSDTEMAEQMAGCEAVASCLGHNLTFKGIFGQPRRLVTDAAKRFCQAIRANGSDKPTKFVLMNTAGNSNRDLEEPISRAQSCVIGLLRRLVPPHRDNEKAADYLRTEVGQNDTEIQWAAVRPDSLFDEDDVSAYEFHPSPTRSAIFNPGRTSRINVAHFMADLITNHDAWEKWKGQMPVIYNKES